MSFSDLTLRILSVCVSNKVPEQTEDLNKFLLILFLSLCISQEV